MFLQSLKEVNYWEVKIVSKCIICKKEGQGIICKHCLAKGACKTGKAVKKSGKIIIPVASAIVSMSMLPKKGKSK